ncbi:MAG: hypothetical protein WDW38_002896 [Sanguina aurantia]
MFAVLPAEAGASRHAHGSSDSLHSFVTEAVSRLEIGISKVGALGVVAKVDSEKLPLLQIDLLDVIHPAFLQSSPVMCLLDTIRYEDVALTAKAFQMLERLCSKREKLVASLMRTFVVTDDNLVLLSHWASLQLEVVLVQFNMMGSMEQGERERACMLAMGALTELTRLLRPMTMVEVTAEVGGDAATAAAAATAATACKGGESTSVYISKVMASNCQFLLHDMQAHLVALKILNLPLALSTSADGSQLSEAQDKLRGGVFAKALTFLRNFMLVGSISEAGSTPSIPNQVAILHSLPLLTSFLGVKGLPASDTLAALFAKNVSHAQKQGPALITRLVKLVVSKGRRSSARLLTLLGATMVVDGTPLKPNQELLLADEPSRLTAGTDSELAFHTACVQLLADCCVGAEAELSVKAMGYMTLSNVVDVLTMATLPGTRAANFRYVTQAYWALLQQCYCLADTEDTRAKVRDVNNRIWPTEPRPTVDATAPAPPENANSVVMSRFLAEASQHSTAPPAVVNEGTECRPKAASVIDTVLPCVFLRSCQTVLADLDAALNEPRDALSSESSATYFLAASVFPALQTFFERHWGNMTAAQPPAARDATECALRSLKAKLRDFSTRVKSLESDGDGGQKAARKLEANHAHNTAMEVMAMDGGVVFSHISDLRLARLLTAPYGKPVPEVLPKMYFEQAVQMLCGLIASDHKAVACTWTDGLLVRMVRVTRTAYEMSIPDNGRVCDWWDPAAACAWARGALLRAHKPLTDELLDWRQDKFCQLGAVHAAVTMMAHPRVEMQLEGLQLLLALMRGGNTVVQDTVHDLLCTGDARALAVFQNMNSGLARCQKYVARKKYDTQATIKTAEAARLAAGMLDAKKSLAAAMDLGKWAGLFGGAAAAGEETPVATASFAAVRNSTTSVSKGPGVMIDLQAKKPSQQLSDDGPAGSADPPLPGSVNDSDLAENGLAPGPPRSRKTTTSGGNELVPPARPRSPPTLPAEASDSPDNAATTDTSPDPSPANALSPAKLIEGLDPDMGPEQDPDPSPPSDAPTGDSPMGDSPQLSRRPSAGGSLAATPVRPSRLQQSSNVGSGSGGGGNGSSGGGGGSSSGANLLPPAPDVSEIKRAPNSVSRMGARALPGLGALGSSGMMKLGGGLLGPSVGGRNGLAALPLLVSKPPDTTGPGPVAEAEEADIDDDGAAARDGADEDDEGDGEEEEEEEEWHEHTAKLNEGENVYLFTQTLLKVMQYTVEGHHTRMQLLLQHQPKAANNSEVVDLVKQSVDLLNVLQDHVGAALVVADPQVPNLMTLVCNFLGEMMQGPCYSNQKVVAGTNFLASCNRVFGCIEYVTDARVLANHKDTERLKNSIKLGMLNVLFSLIEGSPNEDIPIRCMDVLDFGALDRQIIRICNVLGFNPAFPSLYEDRSGPYEEIDEDGVFMAKLGDELMLCVGLLLKLDVCASSRPSALPYLKVLHAMPEDEEIDLEGLDPDQAAVADKLQEHLKIHLGYVEIQWNNIIEPVYFVLTPECAGLQHRSAAASTDARQVWRQQTMTRLQTTVSPESRAFPAVKAAELTDVLGDVVDDIELESRWAGTRNFKWVNDVAKYRSLYMEASFYFAIIALIIQLVSDVVWDPNTQWPERFSTWRGIWLTVVVGIQTLFTVLVGTSFMFAGLVKHLTKHQLTTRWERKEFPCRYATPAAAGTTEDLGSGAEHTASRMKKLLSIGARGLPPPPLAAQHSLLNSLASTLYTILLALVYPAFWYNCMLVAASFTAFFVSPFALVFHFTIYFIDFESGRTLVEAMTRSGLNILNTFVLGVLAIYVCAVITFVAFK